MMPAMRRCALLLGSSLLSAAANAEPDPPLPVVAEAARVHGSLKVLSMTLQVTPDSTITCTGWKLTKADVREFFQKAAPVPGEEFHNLYYTLPCDYKGKLELAGATYDFVINAGWFGTLTTTGSTPVVWRRFGCERGCERMFEPFVFLRPGAGED
jgi:hypothetical protein